MKNNLIKTSIAAICLSAAASAMAQTPPNVQPCSIFYEHTPYPGGGYSLRSQTQCTTGMVNNPAHARPRVTVKFDSFQGQYLTGAFNVKSQYENKLILWGKDYFTQRTNFEIGLASDPKKARTLYSTAKYRSGEGTATIYVAGM